MFGNREIPRPSAGVGSANRGTKPEGHEVPMNGRGKSDVAAGIGDVGQQPVPRSPVHSADIGLPGAGRHVARPVTRLAREIANTRMKLRLNCAAETVAAVVGRA